MTLDEGHYCTFIYFVAITYGKVGLWLWKSPENSEFFFSYIVATLPGVHLDYPASMSAELIIQIFDSLPGLSRCSLGLSRYALGLSKCSSGLSICLPRLSRCSLNILLHLLVTYSSS